MGTDGGETAGNPSVGEDRASLITEFRLGLPLLRDAHQRVPEVEVTVEQELAVDDEATLLTIRATGPDLDGFERALATDETVADVDPIGIESESERRYRLRVPRAHTPYWLWAEQGTVLLEATLCDGGWTVRMRFPDRAALSAFRDCCRQRGWTFDLARLTTADTGRTNSYGLTDGQHALLTAALEAGYFDVPRGTTMAELATEFGVSNQAASERLRRALSNVLGTVP